MANSASITRTQLVYGLCLPLAALIGFFLAEPMRFTFVAVIGLVASLLLWPLFVRWYHPLLVGSLHSAFVFSFLPGSPPLWFLLAFGGFVVVIVNRCLDRDVRLVPPGGVAWALLAIGGVVIATAIVRGGLGLGSFGGASMGGKRIIYIMLAIMAYFVLVSRPVPPNRALLYMGLFTLSSLTGLLSHVIFKAGSGFYWAYRFVDAGPAWSQAMMEWDVTGSALFRSVPMMNTASAIIGFLAVCMGVRGILNLKRPWWLALTLICLGVGTIGGFRSFLVGTGLLLAILFFMEGLHRTRYAALVVALMIGSVGAIAYFADDLPPSVQRSISFLPVKIDPSVKRDADGSVEWRLQMWELLKKEVSAYLVIGKGYGIDPSALQMSDYNARYGFGIQAEWALLAGEYHNGPFSVLIPLGIPGALVFIWFLIVAGLRLRHFCRTGDPALAFINRALFAMFLARVIFFVFFFGSFFSELIEFVVLIGLAESLNSHREPVESEQEAVMDFDAFGRRQGGLL